ncbi:DUF4332 domain-containing protein [Oculatella sp. LEGE 06141]|uniref:DUF4332 domain-containing protein n=1 Tax=Oculatella sp. LEGE 06141 TaxID=1828648 RepID=UPI0018802FF8|nr:DUF4332 domain-containing protein [Oculatella sp. LEGE 06141]MBE9182718.1 DUF4332 domain-containing protein [Oculatella sp. LEGE 06141]
MATVKPSSQPVVRSRNCPIAQLPGLSAQDQAKLANHGIHTTFDLLQQTETPAQKQAIATALQIHIQHINKWVALADLARIPEVGCEHCGLLLHAGIASPAQLAQVPIHRLHRQILKLQVATMQRQDLCPSVDQVSRWIQQAKGVGVLNTQGKQKA